MTKKQPEPKRSADFIGAEAALRRAAEETGTLEQFNRMQELGEASRRAQQKADQSKHPSTQK